MQFEEGLKLDFCDVLLRPKRSEAPSRKAVVLKRTFTSLHSEVELICLPIIAANMKSTGTVAMAEALDPFGALACLHKFQSPKNLPNAFDTVGLHPTPGRPSFNYLTGLGELICLDAANGYTMYFVECVKTLRSKYPEAIIMAGNVVTPEMVQELLLMGADIVKVGIGPGSACTTRIETGVGYPQLSAIIECADAAHGLGGLVCADGGCKTPGDVVKAFAAGADFVMLGGMLAGCTECDGQRVDNKFLFYGMASAEAQNELNGGVPDYATPEGKAIWIPSKGSAVEVIKRIAGGLRSACAYVGANRLKDLPKCATFVRVNRIH